MENKPNNEISDLLARLQQKVEKKSEPKVDSVKPKKEESTEALLSLLKKNIGADREDPIHTVNDEYDIQGYELEREAEETEAEAVGTVSNTQETARMESQSPTESDNSPEQSAEEVEEILHSRVEELVLDSLDSEEVFTLPILDDIKDKAQAEDVISESQAESPAEVVPAEQDPAYKAPAAEDVSVSEAPLVVETIEEPIRNTEIDAERISTPFNEIGEDGSAADIENSEEEATVEIATDEETGYAVLEDDLAEMCFCASKAKQFFRNFSAEDVAPADEAASDSVDFDDTDINLALALGSREELENSVGYFRVRSAKNGFHDPILGEATAKNTYGYCGEEYRSHHQTEEIRQKYTVKHSQIKRQFIFTFLLSVLILFLEHLPRTSLQIPYLSRWLATAVCYYGVALLFSVLLILVSGKRIWQGIHSLFALRAEPFVSVSCLAIFNFIYTAVIFFAAREAQLPVYNFAVAVFLLFGIADDAMRLTREKLAFDVVSEPKEKLSLERFEGNSDAETATAFSPKKEFFVEKVDLVGNFFARSGRRPVQFTEYFHELAFSVLGALFVSLLSLCLGGTISSAFTLFIFTVLACLPMQFLTLGIYPFFHLTKGLSKLESAVIGDAVTEEYHDADTIYLEDTEMFGKHGARIVGLRVYNDMDFYEILSYALSVFALVGAPLSNVFDNSAKEIEKKDGVKITKISVGGLEASLNRESTIYIGNLAFMRSRGYFPKRNPEDEKKIESGQISILYMAIGGELCAKIYMQYSVTQRFEKFAAEMVKNGIHVGIRTLDPNVNEKMIAALRGDSEISIKVIRPTPNELIPIGKHSDSGIVTSKNSHMIFKILEQCFNIKRIHAVQRRLRIGALLLGVAVSAVMMVLKLYTTIPSLYIAIYQLLWLLPALIYTKSKLK